jgi:predicted helicase
MIHIGKKYMDNKKKLAKVFYNDVWGLRKEKYDYLFENDVKTTKWQELEPVAPYYFFVPKDFALQAEYEKFWKVTEIFKEWASGAETGKDGRLIGFTPNERIKVFMDIFNPKITLEDLRTYHDLKPTSGWKIEERRKELFRKKECFSKENIISYAYRPFDIRFTYFSDFLRRAHREVMDHLLKDNIALVTSRLLAKPPFSHVFVTQNVSDRCYVSIKTKETGYLFPLYLYPDKSVGAIHELPLQSKTQRIPNFTPEFLQAFSARIDIPVGAGLVPAQKEATTRVAPTPEEIFYYIYAVLYSPTYRKRYEEFLKIDFPRVPLPPSYDAFKKLSDLGKELADLHLLNHSDLEKTEVGFPKGGSNKVEKVAYAKEDQRVFINKEQYFEGIPKEVWEYRIGAYQVMEKYLKDRKGRKLSLDEINHYIKMAKALQLTIELQEKIDIIFKSADQEAPIRWR